MAPTRRVADAGKGECFVIALALFGFNAGCYFEAVGRTNELMLRISFPEKPSVIRAKLSKRSSPVFSQSGDGSCGTCSTMRSNVNIFYSID